MGKTIERKAELYICDSRNLCGRAYGCPAAVAHNGHKDNGESCCRKGYTGTCYTASDKEKREVMERFKDHDHVAHARKLLAPFIKYLTPRMRDALEEEMADQIRREK